MRIDEVYEQIPYHSMESRMTTTPTNQFPQTTYLNFSKRKEYEMQ